MLFNRNKIKFVNQLESVDCGPACLAMVAGYYKKKVTLKEIKNLCSVTRMGVSVKDIADGGEKLGFTTNSLKLTLEQLEQIPLPAVLFWKQDHFIVLYKIKRKNDKVLYYFADPGYGYIRLDSEPVVKEWMGANDKGVAIVFQPKDDFSVSAPNIKSDSKQIYFSSVVHSIIDFLKKKKVSYFFTFLLLIVGMTTNWFMPLIFKRITDDGILNKSMQVVWILLIAQFGLFLGNFIADFISHWILTKMNFKLSISLKENFLFKLIKLPVNYFDTRLNTDTLQRLTDLNKIQTFVTWKGIDLFLSVINLLVFGVILFVININIFFIFIILSLLSVLWVKLFLKLRAIIEYSLFLRQSENSNNLYEFIMHMPEIKVNGAQKNIITKISDIQEKLNHLELRSLFLNLYQITGVGFLSKLKEIITVAICAYFIIKGEMTLGTLLSVTYILGQLSGPVQSIVSFIRDTQDAKIAQLRVDDVYLEKEENEGTKIIAPAQINSLQIEKLNFKYPGSFNPFVLNNITFSIPINKITAIVGQSGSGKTTLLKLLLAYYNSNAGEININEINIKDIDTETWRKKCGIVMQDGHIFSSTIAENIALSDKIINPEKVKKAAKIACIDSFIETLPMGYNTKIGNTGIHLSGGQKQRLLIARTVYRDPEFIFFDEATNSLDAANEKMIMENLEQFFIGRTVIVVAHRLSTVKNADQIIVLDKGNVTEIGKHKELCELQGVYFNLVKNQLELGNE